MTFRFVSNVFGGFLGSLLLAGFLIGAPAGAADPKDTVAGLPAAEALRQGEVMYQKGFLPSGQPMMALVQGGMEMDTSMCTCSNCHLPSGLGTVEGGVFSPPTNGAKLFRPFRGVRDVPGATMKRTMYTGSARSAYTEDSLAKALTLGVNPDGRTFQEIMPRYELTDAETQILVYYLKHLSMEHSPGLTPDSIRFATIITEEVSPADRDSFLVPLQTYFRDEWNAKIHTLLATWNNVWQVKPDEPKAFRNAELDVWVLKGSPDTWEKQLQEHYRQKPVFAILGGLTTGSWAPMHEFCEQNKVPCLFPYTPLPVISAEERYTYYVSKGGYQEGESAASFLMNVLSLPPETPVVQVYRDDARGRALVHGAASMLALREFSAPVSRVVLPQEKIGIEFWKKISADYPKAVLLLWLSPEDLAGVDTLAVPGRRPLFFSSSMLGGQHGAVPDAIREFSYVMYPYRLPEAQTYSMNMLKGWLNLRKLSVSNIDIASHAVLITNVLSDAIYNVAGEFYREFFMDTLDMGRDQTQNIVHPMLTFGPGQRYASKGCYVVSLTKGDSPNLIKKSDWIVY